MDNLEELDPLANHHVCLSQSFLLNPNYRIDPNPQSDFPDPLANLPSLFPETNV